MISEAQAQGVILTMDRKNYRDLKSSLLGLSVLACIIPGPQQGGENGEESGNLKLHPYEYEPGSGRQIQLKVIRHWSLLQERKGYQPLFLNTLCKVLLKTMIIFKKKRWGGTFLVVQCLRLQAHAGVHVQSLVGELRSHMSRGQNPQSMRNRSDSVIDSMKTLKMVHMKMSAEAVWIK